MSALRAALLLHAVASATTACAAGPEARTGDAGPAAASAGPAVEETLEDGLRAVHAGLDAARNDPSDFAGVALRLQGARDAMFRIMLDVKDPDRRREPGIEELALRVEQERRALLQERMPEEAYRWLRSTAGSKAREQEAGDILPAGDREMAGRPGKAGTPGAALGYFYRQAERDLFDHLARAFVPENEAAELDGLLQADPADLTEAEKQRAIRLSHVRKGLRAELADCWARRDMRGGCTTSYGSGSILVLDAPVGRERRAGTPEQWWEAAPAKEREEWLLSAYAERGGLLEVVRAWNEPCGTCGGQGSTPVADPSTGTGRDEGCRACNGCGSTRRVRWR